MANMKAAVPMVEDTSTTTGTGTLTLDSGAPSGFQSFATAYTSYTGHVITVDYTITLAAEWETGRGQYSVAANTLTRDTVYGSSDSGSAVDWGAGSKAVKQTLAGRETEYIDMQVPMGSVFNRVYDDNTIHIGPNCDSGSSECIVIGHDSYVLSDAPSSIAIGDASWTDSWQTGSIAIGKTCYSKSGVVIGNNLNRGYVNIGKDNDLTGTDGGIILGRGNDLTAISYSAGFVAGNNHTSSEDFWSHIGDAINKTGYGSHRTVVVGNETTDATPTRLSVGGGNTSFTSPSLGGGSDNLIWKITIRALGVQTSTGTGTKGDMHSSKTVITLKWDGANSSVITSAVQTEVEESAGATAWDVSVDVTTLDKWLRIEATGEASKTITWVAHVDALVVEYA